MSSKEGKVDYLYEDVWKILKSQTVFYNSFDRTDATIIRTVCISSFLKSRLNYLIAVAIRGGFN